MSTPAPGSDRAGLDQIVEALREDPVLVHPLFGNGRTEEVREGLREIVDEAGFPAYVVLAPPPPGLSGDDPDRELATLLQDRLGGDGVFVVHTDPMAHGAEVLGFGDVPEQTLLSQAWLDHAPRGGATSEPSLPGRVARDLTVLSREGEIGGGEYRSFAEETPWAAPARWEPGSGSSAPVDPAVAATVAFGVVAAGSWLLMRIVARWRAARREPQPTPGPARRPARRPGGGPAGQALPGPAEIRATAEAELDALAARRSGTDATRPDEPDVRVLVDGSYDAARAILARCGTADSDLADLVGALVLVRTADRALAGAPARAGRKGKGRRGAATPYRPCFFDPRHGQGVHRRSVPVADTRLEVPVCGRCRAVAEDALCPMRVPAGLLGRTRPWYEQDSVWARTGYGAFVEELWHPVAAEVRVREQARGLGR
ncbi:hypothetical protein [Nocardioides campestrisoli]|uniref:hypothetical protein n=1 Tax=Nocardioides campestrisoli TaxID=2736757 RepID=UPI0015E79E2B|nr:hypothetical protein [Nocardioides campestrisoli]